MFQNFTCSVKNSEKNKSKYILYLFNCIVIFPASILHPPPQLILPMIHSLPLFILACGTTYMLPRH